MENEPTTKTPIPTRSGFRNFAICTLIFAFSISLPSTLVETPLQIHLFFRKTNPISAKSKPTQPSFQQRVMKPNHLYPTRKNKPNQTQSPNAIRDTQHAIRKPNPIEPNFKIGKMKISTEIVRVYANQQRTINNERLFKTNPIKPNPPGPLLRRERIQNLGAKRISRFIGPASKIENPVSRIKHLPHLAVHSWLHCAKQTQFQNGQYKHKYSKNKGLCQRTTNNDQRTLSKTKPIKPNSPALAQLPIPHFWAHIEPPACGPRYASRHTRELETKGIEPSTKNAVLQPKTPIQQERCAKSGARCACNKTQGAQNADLKLLVERWPKLPEHIKRAIIVLADG